MKNKILFKEVQKQNQKWIWFLLIILMATTVFGSIQQIIFNKPFGPDPMPDWGFIGIFALLFVFFYFLARSNLYTEITTKHILFYYKPFFSQPKIIKWEEVDNCYVRLYSPIKEYGGWGIRTGIFKKHGKAFNVAGNIGIQIELKNGKKILIGTQKGKGAEAAIKSVKKEL